MVVPIFPAAASNSSSLCAAAPGECSTHAYGRMARVSCTMRLTSRNESIATRLSSDVDK
jgi:hypothetical protein